MVGHIDPNIAEKRLQAEKKFIKKHKQFYQYLKNGEDHLDDFYFNRKKSIDSQHSLMYHDFKPTFGISTPFSELAGCLLGSDQFLLRLKKELGLTDENEKKPKMPMGKWLANKVDFAELCLALCDFVELNGNKSEPRLLAECLSQAIKIDLSSFNGHLHNVPTRHKPSKFLDQLKLNLTDKLGTVMD